jgi:phage tail tape-measure protein
MSAVMDNALLGDRQSFDTTRKLAALSSVLEGNDAVTSVIAADKAVFTLQEAAAVAEGKKNEQDVVENLIDRAAVYVTTWAQQCCIRVCEQAGEKIGAAIGSIFGPAGAAVGAKVGRLVGHWVGEKLKPVVEKGVKMIAEAAKGVWQAIKDVGSSICSGISSAISTVAGWLGF